MQELGFPGRLGHVMIHHEAHKLLEADSRRPSEDFLRFGRISHQEIHFARPVIVWVDVDVSLQSKST